MIAYGDALVHGTLPIIIKSKGRANLDAFTIAKVLNEYFPMNPLEVYVVEADKKQYRKFMRKHFGGHVVSVVVAPAGIAQTDDFIVTNKPSGARYIYMNYDLSPPAFLRTGDLVNVPPRFLLEEIMCMFEIMRANRLTYGGFHGSSNKGYFEVAQGYDKY